MKHRGTKTKSERREKKKRKRKVAISGRGVFLLAALSIKKRSRS